MEILNTGKLKQAEAVKADPKVEALIELQKVAHVGKVAANRFYDAGVKTILELHQYAKANPDKLTDQQTIGLRYHKDISRRIPRTEMRKWEKLIRNVIDKDTEQFKGTEMMVAGSYRRLLKDSGDVDVLLNSQDPSMTLQILVGYLTTAGVIVEILSSGDAQTMVVAKLTRHQTHRRLDIFSYTNDIYPYAVLHSTGSGEHNIIMRNAAIEKGLSLSQYGFKKNDIQFIPKKPIKTEKDIFEYLGVPFKAPENR